MDALQLDGRAESLKSGALNLPEILLNNSDLTATELKRIEYWLREFERYRDKKTEEALLRYMVWLFGNPDARMRISGQLSGSKKSTDMSLFDEEVNTRSFLKAIMNRVRNRFDPDLRNADKPMVRGVRPKEKSKRDTTHFAIEESSLMQIRINFAKRETTTRQSAQKSLMPMRGRPIRVSSKPAFGTRLATVSTLMAAIKNGHYSLASKHFAISTSDFRYPVYSRDVAYNIMLVLDVSNSIKWVLPHVEKIISLISANATRSRDKLGLITFKDEVAQVLHYPTMNIRQVIGTINTFEASGFTPLGDGLVLARQVLGKERFRIPGMKNMIMLISDCFPEPIEGGHENLLDEPCYQKVIRAAREIHNQNIRFLVLNPAPPAKDENNTWGRRLAKTIATGEQARYVELHPKMIAALMHGSRATFSEVEMEALMGAVQDLKMM